MNTRDPLAIADVQSSKDTRRLAIDQVGIKSIRHPVKVSERSGGVQHTIASFNMYVRLPHHFKGTHMSRFVDHGDTGVLLAEVGLYQAGLLAAIRARLSA